MRRALALAFVALVAACGRSELTDYLEEGLDGGDAGSVQGDALSSSAESGDATGGTSSGSGIPDGSLTPEDALFEDVETDAYACNPHTCVAGCCVGVICAEGTQDIACGKGGLACVACQGGQSCVDQTCN